MCHGESWGSCSYFLTTQQSKLNLPHCRVAHNIFLIVPSTCVCLWAAIMSKCLSAFADPKSLYGCGEIHMLPFNNSEHTSEAPSHKIDHRRWSQHDKALGISLWLDIASFLATKKPRYRLVLHIHMTTLERRKKIMALLDRESCDSLVRIAI